MNQSKNDNPDYSSQLHRHIEFLYRELLVTKILLALAVVAVIISYGSLSFTLGNKVNELEKMTKENVTCSKDSESHVERESLSE